MPEPATETEKRAVCVGRARSFLGKPYYWGAEGPDAFDCSGLLRNCLTAVGVYPFPGDAGAHDYWAKLERVSWAERKPGDIVCYGEHQEDNQGCHHVMFVSSIPEESHEDGHQIGACRGGPPNTGESEKAYKARMAARGASVIEVSDWYWKSARLGVVRVKWQVGAEAIANG